MEVGEQMTWCILAPGRTIFQIVALLLIEMAGSGFPDVFPNEIDIPAVSSLELVVGGVLFNELFRRLEIFERKLGDVLAPSAIVSGLPRKAAD